MTASISFSAAIAADLAAMLRRAFGGRNVAKQAARWADCSPHAIRDYLSGRREMGAWKLMKLMRHSGCRAELRALLDRIEREDADTLLQLSRLTKKETDDLCTARLAGAGRTRADAWTSLAPVRAAAAGARAGVRK